MSRKIFVVEDDAVIAEAIAKQLSAWDCEVRCAVDFGAVCAEFADFMPELVLLDITLPFYNGFYWCSKIREISKVPIIFISSASDNMNIVMAMNMGGDDFIPKPFDAEVLTAKVRAMLRRTYDFSSKTELIEHGGLILNLSDNTVCVDDNKLELSKNEYRILEVLLRHGGQIVSREALMQRLWETDSFVDENTLTVNVTRLRHRLVDAGLPADYIKTKKGIGYMIE